MAYSLVDRIGSVRQHTARARGHAAPDRYTRPQRPLHATPLPTATPTLHSHANRATAVCVRWPARRRSVEPAPQRGAPCGVVDFFDFPLDCAGRRRRGCALVIWPLQRTLLRHSCRRRLGVRRRRQSGQARLQHRAWHGVVCATVGLGRRSRHASSCGTSSRMARRSCLSTAILQPDSVVLQSRRLASRAASRSDSSANRADVRICTLRFAPSFPIGPAPATGRSIRPWRAGSRPPNTSGISASALRPA